MKDVGKDVDGSGYIVVEGLGIVDGVFALFSELATASRASRHGYDDIPKCRH